MDPTPTEQFIRLMSIHQEPLYRYVFALLPNEHDAKDVVQETCVALCRKLDEYDPEQPFLPWAFRFECFEVLKHRERKGRAAVTLSEDVVELLARERDQRREMLDARLRVLEQCLGELPRGDMELIRGRYHAQLPIDKLAAQVEMSHRTLFRNLERLRRVLFACITRRLAAEGLS